MQTYFEPLRPQFHFTARAGWLNDPNGLVFYKGTYHLFFQHNPKSVEPANMNWGHATSVDLVHWTERPIAIEHDADGSIWSGSAVIDWKNTSGFQKGPDRPLVCVYACAGDTSPESKGKPFTVCLSYSADGGKTFAKYAGNPVVKEIVHGNRDPKVVWYEPKHEWVMAWYLDGNTYALLTSPDLKTWTLIQRLEFPGEGECPDFFEMPVEGSPEHKWVFVSASGAYLVGSFDGARFTPEQPAERMDAGPNYYAVQTFSDIPASDGRRIQIAWMRGGRYPGMPFNQQMSFPCRLALHGGSVYRLFREPVAEIKRLYEAGFDFRNVRFGGSGWSLPAGDLWDVTFEIDPRSAHEIDLSFRGAAVTYEVGTQTLSLGGHSMNWPLENGRLKVRALIDRTSVELFDNPTGESFSACFVPVPGSTALSISAKGGEVSLIGAGHGLKSAW